MLDNPYFVTPGRDRDTSRSLTFRPGDYTLVAWHERIKPDARRRCESIAGQTTRMNFNIPLPQPRGRAEPRIRPGSSRFDDASRRSRSAQSSPG